MKRLGVGLAIVVILAAGAAGWQIIDTPTRAHAADAAGSDDVPVTTAQTRIQDVPVYLDGLGTVQALNVVQMKAQVTGTIIALPVHEGQEVHTGDIVAEIDPRPYQAALDQALAQRQEDAALLQSATLDLQRYAALAKRDFASIQQVDDQTATVNKDRAAVALDSAAIETAQINLGYCTLKAPVNGRVSFYQVDIGNLIQAGTQSSGIVSITQDKPITVVLTLPESDLLHVQEAMAKGQVNVLTYNSQDSSQLLATGKLMTPNNTIDTTTGTISLKALFDNKDDHLWPGEFVNSRVQVDVIKHAVTVPVPAIVHGPDGMFVWTVKPDQTVDQVDVQVGYEDNGQAVVTKGLTGNETVVVAGQSRVSTGTRVKAANNPASSQANAATASPT
jgi:multidrug efflux system membrane fusion protein